MVPLTPATYGVYVKIDKAGRIVSINSDAFLTDLNGWMKIDEGYGDRYHHAQGNYLDGPLYDDRGICRYKLADGAVVPRTQAEMDADYAPPSAPPKTNAELEAENALLKAQIQAVSDRGDFVEDVIAEMAMQVYE